MDSSIAPTQKKSIHNASVVLKTGSQTPDLGVYILSPETCSDVNSAAHLCPYAWMRVWQWPGESSVSMQIAERVDDSQQRKQQLRAETFQRCLETRTLTELSRSVRVGVTQVNCTAEFVSW